VTGLCDLHRHLTGPSKALAAGFPEGRAIQIHPPSMSGYLCESNKTKRTSVQVPRNNVQSRCTDLRCKIKHNMVSLHVIKASRFRALPGRNTDFRSGDLRLSRSAWSGMPPRLLNCLNSQSNSWALPGLQDRTVAYPRSSKFSIHDSSRLALDLTE
jgi:hypothetical protein